MEFKYVSGLKWKTRFIIHRRNKLTIITHLCGLNGRIKHKNEFSLQHIHTSTCVCVCVWCVSTFSSLWVQGWVSVLVRGASPSTQFGWVIELWNPYWPLYVRNLQFVSRSVGELKSGTRSSGTLVHRTTHFIFRGPMANRLRCCQLFHNCDQTPCFAFKYVESGRVIK